jgi:four helix bundle protein
MRRFVQIARGSANEVENHLLLAKGLDFLSNEEYKDLEARILEIQRMLAALAQSLNVAVLASSQPLAARSRRAVTC